MAKSKYTSIGGSALIEGVMMRGCGRMAIAVRKESGDLILKVEKSKPANKIISKIPLIRGLFGFVSSLTTSYRSLMYSADVSMEDALEEEPQGKFDAWLSKVLGNGGMAVLGAVSMVIGLVFAAAAFIFLPTLITDLFSKYVFELGDTVKRIVVGIFKILIFLGYMLAVSLMKEMRRVFMYHGAEHKTIFCYEAGRELTPENARECRRFHPRCGTSFIVITLLVSFAASMLIPWGNAWIHSLFKFALLPVVMGLAYEFIKLAGKYDNTFTRIISAPGVWMQRITTKEPDDSMLECAIWAMKGVLDTDIPLDTRLKLENGALIPDTVQDDEQGK